MAAPSSSLPAVSKFPLKLMAILDNEEEFSSVITWLPHGRGFTIRDKGKFEKEILPTHFKQTKYTSFTRRLNRWSFTIQQHGHRKASYFHPMFVQGDPERISQMRPIPQRKNRQAGVNHIKSRVALSTTSDAAAQSVNLLLPPGDTNDPSLGLRTAIPPPLPTFPAGVDNISGSAMASLADDGTGINMISSPPAGKSPKKMKGQTPQSRGQDESHTMLSVGLKGLPPGSHQEQGMLGEPQHLFSRQQQGQPVSYQEFQNNMIALSQGNLPNYQRAPSNNYYQAQGMNCLPPWSFDGQILNQASFVPQAQLQDRQSWERTVNRLLQQQGYDTMNYNNDTMNYNNFLNCGYNNVSSPMRLHQQEMQQANLSQHGPMAMSHPRMRRPVPGGRCSFAPHYQESPPEDTADLKDTAI